MTDMMSTNATLLTMKLHELLITDQIWVVESDWLVGIQLKVTCARPFSHRALAPPTSGVASVASISQRLKNI